MTWKALSLAALTLGIGLLTSGCSDDKAPAPGKVEPADAAPAESSAIRHAVTAQASKVCDSTTTLAAASNAFLENPQGDTLATARDAWKQAHAAYQTLAFLYRWAERPMPQIKNDRDPIDAYPLLPGYLDQVPGYPQSGLVFSDVPLTPDFLRKEHQSTDFYYLTLGFHPLEALLWPADAASTDATVSRFTLTSSTATDQLDVPQRRHDLLRLIATGLKRDVKQLCDTRNEAYLVTGLARLEPHTAAAQLEKSLAATLGESLDQWIRQPTGEDRNGMPLAHSPQSLSDFHEWSQVIRTVVANWQPLLMTETGGQEENGSTILLNELADQLDGIDLTQLPNDLAPLKAARATLNKISDKLTLRALQSNSSP